MIRFVTTLNGISMAYVMGFLNAALALLLAFGAHITVVQQGAIVVFLNSGLVLIAHVAHRNGEVHPTPSSMANGQPVISPEPPPAPPPATP